MSRCHSRCPGSSARQPATARHEPVGTLRYLHVDGCPGDVPAAVAHLCYLYGMARVRISTTVDEGLLASARQARSELSDAALIDQALAALLARQRAAEIDGAYGAYDEHPLHENDEWGDLESFRSAAGAS